ncbi:MAG: hypothetical protein KAQ67_05180, partial [Gammaproteobacteria bacterium]|nr:hypothetical protein [Gammaproteobacteria bacterium]
ESVNRHPAIRFSFIKHGNNSDLFINAKKYTTQTEFAELLCDKRQLSSTDLLNAAVNEDEKSVLFDCVSLGYLY